MKIHTKALHEIENIKKHICEECGYAATIHLKKLIEGVHEDIDIEDYVSLQGRALGQREVARFVQSYSALHLHQKGILMQEE